MDDKGNSLLENFEIKGFWWLPENQNKKIPGILKFSAGKKICLNLMGSFHESLIDWIKIIQCPDIILGESEVGTRITLLQTSEIKMKAVSSALSNKQLSSFDCKNILIGAYFSKVDDIKFKNMKVDLTYLTDWLNPLPFKCEPNFSSCKYVAPENHTMKLENIDTNLSIVCSARGSISFDTVFMGIESFFIIEPMESKDLNWFNNFLKNLGNFLTLIIGSPVYPRKIRAKSSHDEHIELYFVVQDPVFREKLHFSQMMIPYNDIKDYLDIVLDNWFKEFDVLGPIYELFLGTYYEAHRLYPHFYFLSLIQGIEGFHRLIYGDEGKYLSDDDYEPIRNTLIKAIPVVLHPQVDFWSFSVPDPNGYPLNKKYPEGFREALKIRIKYGNEYSLRKRFKLLFDKFWESMDGKLDKNRNKFTEDIVLTRNYLTHYVKDSKNKGRILEGDNLISSNVVLKSFLLTALLIHIGITKPDAQRIVLKYYKGFLSSSINNLFPDEK